MVVKDQLCTNYSICSAGLQGFFLPAERSCVTLSLKQDNKMEQCYTRPNISV